MATQTIQIFVNGTDITSLVSSITQPSRKLNGASSFSFIINDENCSLHDSYIDSDADTLIYWKDCQFKTVKVLDFTTRVPIFIGRIERPLFTKGKLSIYCEGEANKLKDKSIPGSLANFILVEGRISDPSHDANADQIEAVETDKSVLGADIPFDWTPDEWIGKGILINDDTDTEDLYWLANTALPTNTFDYRYNDGDATHEDDDFSLKLIQYPDGSPSTPINSEATIDLDGVTILNSNEIREIEIFWKITVTTANCSSFYIENYSYLRLYLFDYDAAGGAGAWVEIYPAYVRASSYKPDISHIITRSSFILTNDPQRFLYDDGSNYSKVTLKVTMSSGETSSLITNPYIEIDYLKVRIKYQTGSFSSIQAEITGNGVDYIQCDGETFESDGVSIGDTFQIGSSTTTVLNTISQFAGMVMDIDPTFNKFIARIYKGMNAMDVLNSICLSEDAYWWEDYTTGSIIIKIRKKDNFEKNKRLFYNFESEETNTNPDGWTVSADSVLIINDIFEHSKCVSFEDTDASGSAVMHKTETTYYIVEDNDEISFDLNTDGTTDQVFSVSFYQGLTEKGEFQFDEASGKFQIRSSGGAWMDVLTGIVDDTWYNIKIIFDVTNNEIDIYIDTILKTSDFSIASFTQIDTIEFSLTGNGLCYIDSIKYFLKDIISTYGNDFEIERRSNFYSAYRILGNPLKGIDIVISDETIDSPLEYLVIDESINTWNDGLEVGNNLKERYGSIRPSYKITLNNITLNSIYSPGYDLDLSLLNPTVTGTFPIRKVDYDYQFPTGLKQTILYVGLGETDDDEHYINKLEDIITWIKKAHVNRQNASTIVSNLSHTALTNVSASQHHTKYTDAEVEAIITAELVDGQSIDNAIDALITTHTGDDNAHHEVFENLVEDLSPQLGADLDILTYDIVSSTDDIKIQCPTGKKFRIYVNGAEVGYIQASGIFTINGGYLYSYSTGNDKFGYVGHNDTDLIINSSSGDIKIDPTDDIDANSNTIKNVVDGVNAQDAVTKSQLDGKIGNVVEDTTPQLGGDLDAQGYNITNLAEATVGDEAVNLRQLLEAIPATRQWWFSNTASDIGGVYKLITATNDVGETTITTNVSADDTLIGTYATASGVPAYTSLPVGYYPLHIHAYVTSIVASKSVYLYAKLFKYETDTTETQIGETSTLTAVLTESEVVYTIDIHIPEEVALDVSDRMVVKIYASLSGSAGTREVKYLIGATNGAYITEVVNSSVITGLEDRITDLEDDTVKLTGAQTIAGAKTFSDKILVGGSSTYANRSIIGDGTYGVNFFTDNTPTHQGFIQILNRQLVLNQNMYWSSGSPNIVDSSYTGLFFSIVPETVDWTGTFRFYARNKANSAYSKYLRIRPNTSEVKLQCDGDIEINASSLNVRNLADNAYVNVSCLDPTSDEHASTKKYVDEKSGLYIDNAINTATPHFTIADFNVAATWTQFDVTTYVPDGSTTALIKFMVRNTDATAYIIFVGDAVDAANRTTTGNWMRPIVANKDIYGQFKVPVSATGKIKYFKSSTNLTVCDILIMGYDQ